MASTSQRATIEDLLEHDGKAELISGRIEPLMPTGIRPNEIAANVYVSLRAYVQQAGKGKAFTGNVGYAVPPLASGRESFSPDASFYDGPLPADLMRFVKGPPSFAVEVRSESDYGDAAENEMAAKRDDYFAAGTRVVWDVDTVNLCVYSYLAKNSNQAKQFQKGEVADAEPAAPGWTMKVDDVFA